MASPDKSVIDTMIAEAGSNPAGLAAVAAVINNRAAQLGITPAQVVQQSGQFQGYSNPGPASVQAQQLDWVRARAEQAWNGITSGSTPDPTNGGTSFRTTGQTQGMAAGNGTVDIGGNTFALGNAPTPAVQAINSVLPQSAQDEISQAYANPAPSGLAALPAPAPLSTNDKIAFAQAPQAQSIYAAPDPTPSWLQPTNDQSSQLLTLPSGKQVAPGTYPASNDGSTYTVSAGPNGQAVVTMNNPGALNMAKMGPDTVAGGYIGNAISSAMPQVQANIGGALNAAGSAAQSALPQLQQTAAGAVNNLGDETAGMRSTIGGAFSGLGAMFGGNTTPAQPTNPNPINPSDYDYPSFMPPTLGANFTGGLPIITDSGSKPASAPQQNMVDGIGGLGSISPYAYTLGSTGALNEYGGGAASPAPSPPTTQYTPQQMQEQNPAYESYAKTQNANDVGAGPGLFADSQAWFGSASPPPTTQYTQQQMQVANPAYEAYIKAQNADDIGAGPGSFADLQSGLAALTPPKTGLAAIPPKTISVNRPISVPMATTATGQTVPIGSTSQGGSDPNGNPYTYTVQPNGSIVNNLGQITATANGPVGVAAVAAQNNFNHVNRGSSNSAGSYIMRGY